MAGFFKKLLGKKDEELKPQDDGGLWTEHEVSVDIHSEDQTEVVLDESVAESNRQQASEATQKIDTQKKEPPTKPDVSSSNTNQNTEQLETAETAELPVVEIATLDTADLKFAMDQAESSKAIDPLDEITAQIQSEIAAERSAKEKKAKLEKLIEVTNQLKRPEFDEDFDV